MLPFKGLIFDISERELSPECHEKYLKIPQRSLIDMELLEKDAKPSLSEKSLRHIKTISRSAKRMGDLING